MSPRAAHANDSQQNSLSPGRRPLVARLDLAGKLAQPMVRELIQRSRAATGHAPVVVELDPTSFCDSACPECISQQLLRTTRFSAQRLLTLSRELVDAGVKAVILIGGGEPLAHPAVSDAIQLLSGGGLQVGLTTSGTMLDRHRSVVAKHAAWTRVSVDAASAATYGHIRPHRSKRNMFDHVIEAMRALADTKQGSLGFSFVMICRDSTDLSSASNLCEIEKAAYLARDIGCDYFEVKPVYDSQHYLVALDAKALGIVEQQLQAIQGLSSLDFEVIAPVTLDEVLSGRIQEQKDYDYCPTTELRTLLTSSGAYVCPYHRGNPRARYGDPTRQPFAELWNNAEGAAQRIVPSRDCKFHCIRHETNELIPVMRRDHTAIAQTGEEPDFFI